ncbi:amino acid/amide ABC transporter membrane protein 2, HAAT family [Anaerovirgula multivorans]|uniref:Amino acid/amide ABC transporter membrane protein 2, HAAT family n=1 Tax=Anaerovirgula multivorans TaxID=312168 RepID=A0A239G6S7_9FIRM|nr:branched-chain amino acid ABC transporter permease [Anaerovirgula multivorans]SNS63744.1 amino acid/amide ABC transporter membrane protein 2, HAAT family [Anaerovirgula multivorans]
MEKISLQFDRIKEKMNFIKPNKKRDFLLLATLILALPYIINSQYLLRIVIMIGVYSILALSLGLVTGYAGQVSLGHAAFYAIGAYFSAVLSVNFGISFFITAPIAAIAAAICGLLLGLPTLRLSGTYLAITTLGFCEVVRMVLLNWEKVTNGPLGINRIPRPSLLGFDLTLANNGMYYLMVFFLVFTTVVMLAIVRSKIGRAMMAIREDELAATMMGIKTTTYKVIAFVVSAFFSGLAGAFYAHMIRFIDPNTFTFDTSIMILSIVILGGMGTIKGMFLGAAILVSFPEVLRFLQEYRFVVYGMVLVLMMRFRPQGILGGQKKTAYKLPKGVIVDINSNNSSIEVREAMNTVEEVI